MNNYFKNIKYVDVIESTNKELKKDIYQDYDNYVLISNYQTEGRGRLGRTFVSNKDAGLYMSIRIKPNVEIPVLQNLTCVVAAITALSIEEQIKKSIDIKWVNDIYINNFKIAGILVESKLNLKENKFDYLIIGIGINLYNQEFDHTLSLTASSVEAQTGQKISKEKLIKSILQKLSIYLQNFDSKEYMKEYISRNLVIGKKIKLMLSNELIECSIINITECGELIINHNNTIRTITSGEVLKTYL